MKHQSILFSRGSPISKALKNKHCGVAQMCNVQILRRPPQEGSTWDVAFKFRGKERKMTAAIARLEGPTELRLATVANGLDGVTKVELVAL